jgi:A1 cistron-splicing factor AAR2
MESANSPVLLLLDLTPAALVGIDLLSFTTTPRFRGVKGVPSGLHFTYTGANAVVSERHGLWFNITSVKSDDSQQPLVIARWDDNNENLLADTDATENLRWRANLGEFWREALTPYRQSSATSENGEVENWMTLTSCITPGLMNRIIGSSRWNLSSGSSAVQDIEAIPGFSVSEISAEYQRDQILHFLAINLKQTWRPGATGRERSEAAQDRSWALLNLTPDLDEIIGELQFCFLMLLTLNNFSCLEQWKRLLELIFTSTTAVAQQPDFFIRAIAALRLQLQHCKDAEGGLIDLADEGGSLLGSLLTRFRRGLERSTMTGGNASDVIDELDDLEDYLREQHGWQFGGNFARSGMLEFEDGEQVRATTTAYDEDDEIGEFAPEIVDLTPEQLRMIGGGGHMAAAHSLEGGIAIQGSDWGTRRSKSMGKGLFVEDRTVQRFVVDQDGSSDDDDHGDGHEDDVDDENERVAHLKPAKSEDEESEEEETQDLEDMDSRY